MSFHSTFPAREPSVEELLWSWPSVCRAARDDWARGFALSILGQSKRRNWKPSPKQLGIMRRMVSDLYRIDGDDDDWTPIEGDD